MLKRIGFISQQDCTGCESCCVVCGSDCISMVQNRQGFYYPMIETDKCVSCGACQKVCPVLNQRENKSSSSKSKIYACRAKDVEIVKRSSSGGIFTILADYILEHGGYVCGASWDRDLKVVHRVVNDKSALADLRGSKYVQSHVADALSMLRSLNRKNAQILFIGTPCQVAGARRILGSNSHSNTVFVEVVCHGVPSPGVFEQYIKELESEFQSKAVSLNFRDKTNGWKSYRFKAAFNNGRSLEQDGHENPYIGGFLSNLYIRDCCTTCNFKSFKSGADITLGDFWGVEMLKKDEYSDDRGVSLVCVNTALGENIFSAIKHNLIDITETDLNTASLKNTCLVASTEYNPKTKRFYKFLKDHPFHEAVVMATKNTFVDRVRISLTYRFSKIFNAKS